MPDQLKIGLSEIDVQSLVEDMEKGKIVLPDFQRDFVWPTDQVGKLLESLLNGYYINTLLTLPVATGSERKPPFPPRRADGTPNRSDLPFDIQMVLDGQQRITSIYYAVSAPDLSLANTVYPQVYCLKLEQVLEGKLDEDTIIWRRGDWESTQRLVDNDLGLQLDRGLIPFTIFKSKDTFKQWRRNMERLADNGGPINKDQIDKFEDETEVFRNYKIPIIQLAADTPESKVVRTFERINTQGLELGVFDILTARLWTEDIRLRNLWEETLETYPRISTYSTSLGAERFRELLLKALALSRGHECKDRNLRELDPERFEQAWAEASRMVDRALEKLFGVGKGGFGVTDRFGVPYTTMLAPLSVLLEIAEREEAYPYSDRLQKIHRWYWSAVFSKRYSGSSDTKSYQDLVQMSAWMRDGGDIPGVIQAAPGLIPVEMDLWSLTRGGLYRGIMALLSLNGAQDFATLEGIDLHEVDDHHIFPKSRLEKGVNGQQYTDSKSRDRILNRTIIEARSNRFKYSDQLPSEYLPSMIDEHPSGESGVRELLRDHFIDDDAFDAMRRDDYENFCRARMRRIREAIEDRIGQSIEWEKEEQEIT